MDARETIDAAWDAYHRQDLPEAARLWGTVREQWPDDPVGYIGGARCFGDTGDLDGADALLKTAAQRFKSDASILAGRAWLAHRRRDWLEALRRWEDYRAQFPDAAVGYFAASIALRELGLWGLSDAILVEGMRRQPNDHELAANYGWTAHHQRDWPEAVRRWTEYHKQFPNDPVGYSSLGAALGELKCHEEADAVLQEGLRYHPTDGVMLSNYAWLAYNRRDWPEALVRWTGYRDQFPNDPLGHYQVTLVHGELGEFAEAERVAAEASMEHSPDVDVAKLMFSFESLGRNCEFGMVQRHYGAEPLGLLRFTGIPPMKLVAGLENRFEGVGDPKNTGLSSYNGEYTTTDLRYEMVTHTGLRDNGNDRDDRFKLICRRLRFLREKLLDDLSKGEKLFLYGYEQSLTEEELQSIFQALRSYGENKLLIIQPATNDRPAGSLRIINEDLLIGYVDRFDVANPSFAMWLRACKQANAYWNQNLASPRSAEATSLA